MSSQPTLALNLIRSGAFQLLAAFIWGTQIANTPYPRIALSAHMNQIQEGLLAIAAGIITRDTALLTLTPLQMNIVVGAHLGLWVFNIVSYCNSWWGTNSTLKMLAKQAEAPGGKGWQETVVGLVAVIFPVPLIPAWGIIAYKLLC